MKHTKIFLSALLLFPMSSTCATGCVGAAHIRHLPSTKEPAPIKNKLQALLCKFRDDLKILSLKIRNNCDAKLAAITGLSLTTIAFLILYIRSRDGHRTAEQLHRELSRKLSATLDNLSKKLSPVAGPQTAQGIQTTVPNEQEAEQSSDESSLASDMDSVRGVMNEREPNESVQAWKKTNEALRRQIEQQQKTMTACASQLDNMRRVLEWILNRDDNLLHDLSAVDDEQEIFNMLADIHRIQNTLDSGHQSRWEWLYKGITAVRKLVY